MAIFECPAIRASVQASQPDSPSRVGRHQEPVREIKLKLTSAKHAALESLRKHLTGDVDADLTPEQKRDRLNYLLQKAGYVRPNTETKQEQVH